jgi:putative SOS response-associated peptidase YedK
MCNLYSMTTNQEAIRRLFRVVVDNTGNLPPLPGIYPDYPAPVVRNSVDSRELMARWGMPTPPKFLEGRKDPTRVSPTSATQRRRTHGNRITPSVVAGILYRM